MREKKILKENENVSLKRAVCEYAFSVSSTVTQRAWICRRFVLCYLRRESFEWKIAAEINREPREGKLCSEKSCCCAYIEKVVVVVATEPESRRKSEQRKEKKKKPREGENVYEAISLCAKAMMTFSCAIRWRAEPESVLGRLRRLASLPPLRRFMTFPIDLCSLVRTPRQKVFFRRQKFLRFLSRQPKLVLHMFTRVILETEKARKKRLANQHTRTAFPSIFKPAAVFPLLIIMLKWRR